MVRFKNRWILVELIPVQDGVVSLNTQLGRQPTEITGKDIWSALKQNVITNFGDAGWGAVGYSLTGQPCKLGGAARNL
jgi:ribonuclease P/MRP protein subunit POP5